MTSGKEKRARAPFEARALCGQGCRQEGGASKCSTVQILARVQGGGCIQAAEVPAREEFLLRRKRAAEGEGGLGTGRTDLDLRFEDPD
jgi:hypothetical protein